jgi:hypothetical protein
MHAAHGEHQFSFNPSAYITFKKTKTKKKYGGRVGILAAESDLHSQDGPPSNRFCRRTEAKLRQQTRDAQNLPLTKSSKSQICSVAKIIIANYYSYGIMHTSNA